MKRYTQLEFIEMMLSNDCMPRKFCRQCRYEGSAYCGYVYNKERCDRFEYILNWYARYLIHSILYGDILSVGAEV